MTSTTETLAQVTKLASNTASTAWNFTGDFLIIIALLAAFFLFAWYVGRGPFVAVILAFYGAFAVYKAFPYMSYLPSAPALTALASQLTLYFALTFIFYLILRRVVVSDFLYVGVFGLFALSFLAAGFLIALAYHLFPVDSVYHFTPAMNLLFAPEPYFFWWFVAPAIGLFFLAR